MYLKVALIQFCAKSYALESNLKKALLMAKKAIKKSAKLIIFPELFDSGYCVEDRDSEYAIDFDKQNHTVKILKKFCKQNDVYIIACSIQTQRSKLYDTAYIVSKDGILNSYKKTCLWADEKKRFERGQNIECFELDFDTFKLKIGIGICYEIGFPEIARALALKGAKVLIYPSAFGKQRLYAWDIASRARALENGVFVLACNRNGEEVSKISGKNLNFAGHSRIVNPQGKIIKQIKNRDGICITDINLKEVDLQRESIPYLKDLKLNQELVRDVYLNM